MTATASPPGTALLAGATGDLGGLILRDLVGLGATVRVLTRPGTNTARIAQLRSQGAEVVRTRYDDPDGPPESLRKCGLRGLRYQRSRPRNRRRSSAPTGGGGGGRAAIHPVRFLYRLPWYPAPEQPELTAPSRLPVEAGRNRNPGDVDP